MVEAISNFASFLGEIFKKVNIESICIAGAVGVGLHYFDVDTNLCIIAGLLTIPFISLITYLWNRNKAKQHYKETLKKEQAETIRKNDGFVDFLESYFITLDFRIQYAILELSKRTPVGNKYMYAVRTEDSLCSLLKFASEKLVFNPISTHPDYIIQVIENDSGIIVGVVKPVIFDIANKYADEINTKYAKFQADCEEYRKSRIAKYGTDNL